MKLKATRASQGNYTYFGWTIVDREDQVVWRLDRETAYPDIHEGLLKRVAERKLKKLTEEEDY